LKQSARAVPDATGGKLETQTFIGLSLERAA
jgi:hypothetical protein